jgi:chromosome segregation ATPase
MASRLEQHEQAMDELRKMAVEQSSALNLASQTLGAIEQAAASPRPPDTALEGELRQLESRTAARLEQHEQAMDELRKMAGEQSSALSLASQTLGAIEQAATSHRPPDTALEGELRQLESRTAARLEQHEQAMDELRKMAGEQSLALNLASQTLGAIEQAAASPRPPDTALEGELRQLESRTAARLEQHEQAMDQLRKMAGEQSSALNLASQTLGAIQVQLVSLEGHMGAVRERAERAEQMAGENTEGARREAAGLQVSVAGELHALELTVKTHAGAIESIRGAMARTDDFMERVVEALESLQTMVLEQAHSTSEQA